MWAVDIDIGASCTAAAQLHRTDSSRAELEAAVHAAVRRTNINIYVGIEVFTAVVMKSTIFGDITPCTLLSDNRRFGGTYCLHLQGRRNNFSKKPACKQVASLHAGFLPNLFFRPRRWRRYFPPKLRLTLNGLPALYPRRWYSSSTSRFTSVDFDRIRLLIFIKMLWFRHFRSCIHIYTNHKVSLISNVPLEDGNLWQKIYGF
jgi:hypothetical protein